MDLNLIKKPVITEKSTANAQFNKYIFEVRNDANKINIKTIKDTTATLLDEKSFQNSLIFFILGFIDCHLLFSL